MREQWQRGTPELTLDAAAAGRLLEPLFPGAVVTALEPARGGLANTNIRVALAGRAAPVLLRLYQQDPPQARKEAAVVRLIGDQVPVPRFLHVSDTNPITGRPYAVVEWVEGVRLETVFAGMGDGALARLGHALGQALAAVHGFGFDKFGFPGADLRIPAAIDLDRDGLIAYLEHCFLRGRGGARIGADLTAALLAFAAREGGRLDAWLERPCLVHTDFNGSNILVRRKDGAPDWELAAIVDWENALGGTPAFDFGNLLRPPLGARAGFADAVAAGYRAGGGSLPADWRRIARICDLYNWAEFLNR
ncbi:MAG TPA: phosphotransferase, partial [Methylomirabilota bacterium]|nr:phosphotransferase [Methylomirabilota bacterium]